ncbi:NACHT domain-containing protein [Flavisphingomonas formosensis]|uniref:NACHT domain-containing protein n=1 Tax=Flavisphingomonas formosensis TaxID=861534 RepID=UPI0018DF4E67|nr:NACHT domain-containing protein [Sphingomonas formosensis]
MTEAGGPTTQAGIFYQNSVAAIALADLLELRPQSPKERVVEVRVEAPENVDDIVIRYADGHHLFQSVKLNVQPGSDPWKRLWQSLEAQRLRGRTEDRFAVVFGESNATADGLIELCERAKSSVDDAEWKERLTQSQTKLLEAVEAALGATNVLELLRKVDVTVMTHRQIESDFDRRRLADAFALPANLLGSLRDIAGGGGRTRAVFLATPLRRRLQEEYGIEVGEPSEWGLPAYRSAIARLARIDIPGTGMSGPTTELFVWPTARSYDRARIADFEDEELSWREAADDSVIDLRAFPSPSMDRCIVVAGPGYGKSALMWAVAERLALAPQVPVIIPLASLAASDLAILDFLSTHINSEMSVRPDWQRLAEQGLLTLLLDGLDEIPAAMRPTVLHRLATFSARFPLVPWMLSVRDPSVLTSAIDGELIELTPLSNDDILRFAETMKKRLPKLDQWDFLERLRAYPDLERLARIPLFLAMLLAISQQPGSIPTTRADLIERYLKTLFAPHEHKAVGHADQSVSALRAIAEQLAFERLERQEIGASEREVLDVIRRSAPALDADQILSRLRANGILRPQSSIRLQFPFPIVQEYLAACHLVREWPDTLASRIDDAIQRPWAQVIQFALELHPAPTPVIRGMLDRPDDAFATGLRLVGRCIVNGAVVDEEVRQEVERRLVAFWVGAPTDARKKVGRLLTDGFTEPLSPDLAAALHNVWLMHDGAGDILSALKNKELTLSLVRYLIERGPKRHSFYFDLKGAISAAGDDAFHLILARVRKLRLSADAREGCGDLLAHFTPGSVSRDLALTVALDEKLPDKIRVEAACIAAIPLDDRLIPLLEKVLRGKPGSSHYAAHKALAFYPDRAKFLLSLLRDPKLDKKRKQDLAGAIVTIFPDETERAAFIAQCRKDPSLDAEIRWVMQIFAARYGNRAAFADLIQQFQIMPEMFVGQVISLFGHFPGRELALAAVEQLRKRLWSGKDVTRIANAATTGMFYIYEMDFMFGGALKTAPPHAGVSDFMGFVAEAASRNDLTESQRLSLLAAASSLGSEASMTQLEQKVMAVNPDDPIYDDDDMGYSVNAAIRAVRKRKVMIPLATAARFVRAKLPNVPMSGISAIEAHADREALDLLVDLHRELDGWHERDMLANAIERLAARLSVTILKGDNRFTVVERAPRISP